MSKYKLIREVVEERKNYLSSGSQKHQNPQERSRVGEIKHLEIMLELPEQEFL